ncbi:MAG TPA: patatin-like phospholipase family protein [Candidatus Paceibacterota bacterium]
MKKIGLALGGGGAKGLAHIGIIKALKEANLPIDYIAGTSMGAVVGAWYASKLETEELEEISVNTKRRNLFPIAEILSANKKSLFVGDAIEKLLKKYFDKDKIEDCKIPFAAVATNMKDGEPMPIKSGYLADAVRASSSIPVVFSPVHLEGDVLVDGGLSNPVPADIVKEMGADYVIAVDVSSKWPDHNHDLFESRGFYATMMESMAIIEYQLAKNILKEADLVIRPSVMRFNWPDFDNAEEIISLGYREGRRFIKEIALKTGYPIPEQSPLERFFDFFSSGE